MSNIDPRTVDCFGYEWTHYNQSALSDEELDTLFNAYFDVFPWPSLPSGAVGFDMGCGSGRWAKRVAERVALLHCLDASEAAVGAAQRNLAALPNCVFHVASVDAIPLPDASMDFGYCLGVLHHVPDTQAGLTACVRKLRPGAPFLVYLYYNLDNRSAWYRALWYASDMLRRLVCRLPLTVKSALAFVIAATVYYPLARLAWLAETCGLRVERWPLAFYRQRSFFVTRTDAFDRFATRLEKRFSAAEIEAMMKSAGLERITFSPAAPFWHAVGFRRVTGGCAASRK